MGFSILRNTFGERTFSDCRTLSLLNYPCVGDLRNFTKFNNMESVIVGKSLETGCSRTAPPSVHLYSTFTYCTLNSDTVELHQWFWIRRTWTGAGTFMDVLNMKCSNAGESS